MTSKIVNPFMLDNCYLDGRDAGAGDLIAWTETAPRLPEAAGGVRRTVAWVIKEEQQGAVFILDVRHSDGAAAYPVGTVLRRQARMLQRNGMRRQARIAEQATTSRQAEQLGFGF